MAHQVVLEFIGVSHGDYWGVNQALGIDVEQTENWPEGITSHTAGTTEDGTLVVTEVWESPEHQARFMEERLGAALGELGVPPPARVTWVELVSDVRL